MKAMKKTVKKAMLSCILVVSSLLVLGAYYVLAASDRMPPFILATVQGDEREASEVEIHGYYLDRWNRPSLVITSRGADYETERSMYQLEVGEAGYWYYGHPEIAQLIDEYRSFMRGKDMLYQFYQDDESVIYIDVVNENTEDSAGGNLEWVVEVLDKSTKRVNKFAVEIPVEHVFQYIQILDVQRIDDEIHVLTSHAPKGASEFLRLYVIDEPGELYVRSVDTPGGSQQDEEVDRRIHVTPDFRDTKSSDYVVLSIEEEPTPAARAAMLEETDGSGIRKQYYVYSYRTGEVTDLSQVWETAKMEQFELYALEKGGLYTHQPYEDKVEGAYFEIATGEQGVLTVTTEQLATDEINTARIRDGKLYVMYEENISPTVQIFDLRTGEVLYKGVVTLKDHRFDHDEQMELLLVWGMILR